MQKIDFTFMQSGVYDQLLLSPERNKIGDDYIQAKILDDRINSDVDENISNNFSSFVNITKKE